MTADTITAIKNDIEAEIERVVQSVNEWDDRTSPDDYPQHLLITSEELADILRNFANFTLESLQRENEWLRKALKPFAKTAGSLPATYGSRNEPLQDDDRVNISCVGFSLDGVTVVDLRRARALSSTGDNHE